VALSSALVAAERDVAEWVIRQGGRVMIDDSRAPLARVTDLPAGGMKITGIDLTGNIIEPKELERISTLTTLKELYLPGPSWNPGAGSRVNAQTELKFLAGLKNLERLQFSLHFLTNVNVRDEGIEQFSSLTQLKEFRCAQCRIQKPSLTPFVNLRALDLNYANFGDEAIKSLEGMRELKRLYLRDTLVTDDGLQHLSGLTQLEELDLYGTKISDRGIAYLRNLKKLRKLNILGAPVTDESIDVLAGMTQLRELNLYRSQITNSGLARLSLLRELVSLDLRYSRVTSTGVDSLRASLPNCDIEFINASVGQTARKNGRPTGTGDKAIADWVTSLAGKVEFSGGRLRAISLGSVKISDAQTAHLAGLSSRERLDLQATEVGDLGLQQLKRLTSLKELNLGNTTVSDAGLAHLAPIISLRVLRLSNTLVSGPGLAHLKGLGSLTELDLMGSPVTDDGLLHLAALTSLERLSLGHSEVTDAGLAHLSKLTNLKALDLNANDIGDDGLRHLGAMTNLRELLLNYPALPCTSTVASLFMPAQ
jgi:Leucine-rich repeat (LRR) protein